EATESPSREASHEGTEPEREAARELPPGPRPPEILDFVEATYPPDAVGDAEVVLELTIDATGQVLDAVVVDDPGQGFAEAARTAALAFRFHPAEVESTPVPAKIRFTYRFEAPAATTPEPTAEPGAEVTPEPEGEVLSIRVRSRSVADERRHSVDAVQVIELGERQRQVVDLGSVIERDSSVSLRRSGGLGSAATVTLGGLGGNRVPV